MSETYGSGSRRVFKQRPLYLGIGLFPPVITVPQTEYTKSLVHMHGAAALSRRPLNRSSTRVLFLRYDCSRSRPTPRVRVLSHLCSSPAQPGVEMTLGKKGRERWVSRQRVSSTFILRTSCTSRSASYHFACKSHSRQITNSRALFFRERKRARSDRGG